MLREELQAWVIEVNAALRGCTLDDATKQLVAAGVGAVRVVKQDGLPTIGTRDYDPRRVNLEVVDGRIARVVGLG